MPPMTTIYVEYEDVDGPRSIAVRARDQADAVRRLEAYACALLFIDPPGDDGVEDAPVGDAGGVLPEDEGSEGAVSSAPGASNFNPA